MRFEVGAPERGIALRLRLWAENTTAGHPREPRTELVELRVDGKPAAPVLVETKNDRYYRLVLEDIAGEHRAEAQVRLLDSGRIVSVANSWQGGT